jgi:predicted AAA+ superfamily ATPase
VENLLFLSYLKINDKYYLADIGLRYFLLGSQKADMGRMIENVVYLELLRRGYDVSVGKFDSNEIDFVAINDKSIEYYQVAQTTREEKTLERELKPLNKISDHNQKFLLTLDEGPLTSYNGIKKINILD